MGTLKTLREITLACLLGTQAFAAEPQVLKFNLNLVVEGNRGLTQTGGGRLGNVEIPLSQCSSESSGTETCTGSWETTAQGPFHLFKATVQVKRTKIDTEHQTFALMASVVLAEGYENREMTIDLNSDGTITDTFHLYSDVGYSGDAYNYGKLIIGPSSEAPGVAEPTYTATSEPEILKFKISLSVKTCKEGSCQESISPLEKVEIPLSHCTTESNGNATCKGVWETTVSGEFFQFYSIVQVFRTTTPSKQTTYRLGASSGIAIVDYEPTVMGMALNSNGTFTNTFHLASNKEYVPSNRYEWGVLNLSPF